MDRGNSVSINNTFNFNQRPQICARENREDIYERVDSICADEAYCNMRPSHPRGHRGYISSRSESSSMGANIGMDKILFGISLLLFLIIGSINVWTVISIRELNSLIIKHKKVESTPKAFPLEDSSEEGSINQVLLRTILKDTSYNLPKLIRHMSPLPDYPELTRRTKDHPFDIDIDLVLKQYFEIVPERVNRTVSRTRQVFEMDEVFDPDESSESEEECDRRSPRGRCSKNNDRVHRKPDKPEPTLIPQHRPRGPPGLRKRVLTEACSSCFFHNPRLSCLLKSRYLKEFRGHINQALLLANVDNRCTRQ